MIAKPALTSLVPREAIAECDRRDAAEAQVSKSESTKASHGRAEALDPFDAELLRKAAGGMRLRG
jgi:hypothetical protein